MNLGKLGFAIPHEIRIKASANMGFIVKVGCGEFVAANKHDLIDGIEGYIDTPDKWEKEYNKLPGRGTDEAARPVLSRQELNSNQEEATEGTG